MVEKATLEQTENGAGPCEIVMVGSRAPSTIVYPVSDPARKHGAGVETETDVPREAHEPFERPSTGQMPDGALHG